MIHFWKLIRPVNLIIIAATMYGLGAYFDLLLGKSGYPSTLFSFSFFLLVFSTVAIAAAGNIINDYFDVRADRVNRPERLIVGKHVKRRWAIFWHWLINAFAFVIAFYLSYKFKTFWYLFVHLLSINLLWFYSVQLKRTLVVGNVVIALLTALVPVLVGIYFNQYLNGGILVSYYPFQFPSLDDYFIYSALGFALFAFLFNWTREIIKDIEDIEGDRVLKARTIPIVMGIKKAKWISLIMLFIPIVLSNFLIYAYSKELIISISSFYPLFLAAIAVIIAFILGIKANYPGAFRKTHLAIKFVMVLGLSLPLYWAFLIYFGS